MTSKIIIWILILLSSCYRTEKKSLEFDFFVGIWKRENKEQYEVWEKKSPFELIGHSYRIKNKKNHYRNIGLKKKG